MSSASVRCRSTLSISLLDIYALTDTMLKQSTRCLSPTGPGKIWACNVCAGCRRRWQSQWVFRMQVEADQYPLDHTTFLTLTFKPEDLPSDVSGAYNCLQLFFKRFRRAGYNFRYVAALEQGTKSTKRFHWHLILYGVKYVPYFSHRRPEHEWLRDLWTHGHILWEPISTARMWYVLKYVTKGNRLYMSRRPGIGAQAVPHIQSIIKKQLGVQPQSAGMYHSTSITRLTRSGKSYSVSPYYRNRIRIPSAREQIDGTPDFKSTHKQTTARGTARVRSYLSPSAVNRFSAELRETSSPLTHRAKGPKDPDDPAT